MLILKGGENMACPSSHPISTGTHCSSSECGSLCKNDTLNHRMIYLSVVHYYERCKNSSGETICNYTSSENLGCSCLY